MANIAVYIDGQKIDLADAKVALTFQINDIAELKDRQSNFTNRFKVPKTARNKAVFENAELVQSGGDAMYRKLPATIMVDGVQVVSNGYALLESTGKEYEITIYSGIAGFFDAIEGANIRDLNLSQWNHDWNKTTIKNKMLSTPTDGYLYAAYQYSSSAHRPTIDENEQHINGDRLLPMFYIHTLVRKIFQYAGQDYESDFFNTAFFKSLAMPLISLKNNQDYQNDLRMKSTGSYSRTSGYGEKLTNNEFWSKLYGIPLLPTAQPDPAALVRPFTVSNSRYEISQAYVAPVDGDYSIKFECTLAASLEVFYMKPNCKPNNNFTIAPALDPRPLYMIVGEFFNSNNPPDIFPMLSFQQTLGFYLFYVLNVPPPPGQTYSPIITVSYTNTFTLKAGEVLIPAVGLQGCESVSVANYTFEVTNVEAPESKFDGPYPINPNIPDMAMTDLLKDLAQMFALMFYQNLFTGKLHIRRFDEIYDNLPYAVDWSEKLDLSKTPEIEYEVGDYARYNSFNYSSDSQVEEDYAKGILEMPGDRFSREKEIVNLKFAPSKPLETLNGRVVAGTFAFDADGKVDDSLNPRIVIVFKGRVNSQHISLSGPGDDPGDYYLLTTGSYIPFAYFDYPQPLHTENEFGKHNLTFSNGYNNDLLEVYYNGLKKVLTQPKKVTAYFRLTLTDILNLDHFTPVHVDYFGSDFYINKIVDYMPGEITKVELIKL